MHLEYNYRNQMKGFRWWLGMMVMAIILFIILWYLGLDMKYWKEYLLYAFMPYFFILTVPLLFFHIRYYLRNRGQIIDILDDRLILTKRNGECKEYLFSEIDKALFHPNVATGYTLIDDYSCLKLVFKDFEEPPVYITCFMHPNLYKVTMELKGAGMSILYCGMIY